MPSKLRPYGSKRKLKPFGSSKPDPLAVARKQIEETLAEQDRLIAEELRLFEIVDRYDMRGKHDTDAAIKAREQWNAVWRRLDRIAATLLGYSQHERSLNGRKP